MPLSGFIYLDKPADISSNHVIQAISKHHPDIQSIGHTGTLDPMATGLLVVAVNRATKFIQYLNHEPKIYETTLRFGLNSTSLDNQSFCQFVPYKHISNNDLRQHTDSLIGHLSMPIPIYSACKFQGKPLYHYARKNIKIHLPDRQYHIHNVELISHRMPESSLRITCSHGTYIRSFIEILGQKCHTSAIMTQLRRTHIAQASPRCTLENCLIDWQQHITPIEQCLPYPLLRITPKETQALHHGKILSTMNNHQEGIYCIMAQDHFAGLAEIKNNELKLLRFHPIAH